MRAGARGRAAGFKAASGIGGAAVKQSLDVDSALGDCEARLLRDLRGQRQTPLRRRTTVVSFDKALIGAVRRSALSGFAAEPRSTRCWRGPVARRAG